MQIVPKLATLIFLFLSAQAGAVWDSPIGGKAALSGLVLATPYIPGQNPSAYFDASPAKVKSVTTAAVGERLALLTVISNPLADAMGFFNVQCNIRATRPDGSISLQQRGIGCLKGQQLAGGSNYVSPMVIKFMGETGDPLGLWLFEVEVHDINRGTRRLISTQFTLTDTSGLANIDR